MREDVLRFVVLVDSLRLPAWQACCLSEVAASGTAEPVGVVIRLEETSWASRSRWRDRWAKKNTALWRLFSRFFVEKACKATKLVDFSDSFRKTPKIYDRTKVGRFGQELGKDAIDFVKTQQPDFILRLGDGILRGEILGCSRYGVWSYHHSDPSSFRGEPSGFWEIYFGSPVTGAILQVLGADLGAGIVLQRGFFPTVFHSYPKTRDAIYFGSAAWVRRTCETIKVNGWPLKIANHKPATGQIYKIPTNREMLRFFRQTVQSFVSIHIRYKLFRQSWNIAAIPAPIGVVAGLEGTSKQRQALAKARWMQPLPGHFVADPFGYKLQGKQGIRILFECFNWTKNIGHIASADFDGKSFGDIKTVMAPPTHLSYPYVAREGGEIYFIPESSAAGEVSAFRIDHNANVTEKLAIFSRVGLIDATFVEWQGRHWCFAVCNDDTQNSELHIFMGDRLIRETWRPHALNPVKIDVRGARPGGTPFVYGGKLYRPSQDCSANYGSAVVINEIITLNEHEFEEAPISRLQHIPDSEYTYGLHTLSQVGEYTLIDAAKKISVLRASAYWQTKSRAERSSFVKLLLRREARTSSQ